MGKLYKNLKRARVICSLIVLTVFVAMFVLPDGVYELARIQFIPASIRVTAVVSFLVVLCLVLPVVLALLWGRLYCSFLCPLGVVQDIAIRLRRILKARKLKGRYSFNHRLLRYSVLMFLFFASVMGAAIPLGILDPFSIFGRFGGAVLKPCFIWLNNLLADSSLVEIYPMEYAPFSLAVLVVGATVFSLIFIAAFFRQRLFCNTLCPVGAMLGIISRVSLYKIRFNSETCIKCGKCSTVCKSGCLDFKNTVVDSERCVACFNCLTVCPTDALGYKRELNQKSVVSVEENASRRDFMVIGGASVAGAVLAPSVLCEGKENWKAVMPPGAVDFERFSSKCTACQLCVSNCPGNVLKPAALQYGIGGFLQPRLDFDSGMCEFDCTVCSEICPSGALTPLTQKEKQQVRLGVAEFNRSRCVVSTDHTNCAACAEHCPTGAVHMVSLKRGAPGGGRGGGDAHDRDKRNVGNNLRIPQVEPELCIGCGACEFVCPVRPEKAIIVRGLKKHCVAQIADNEQAVDNLKGQDFPF